MYAAKTDAPLCAKHLVCEEFYLHIYEASAKITMRDGYVNIQNFICTMHIRCFSVTLLIEN